ncbi:MAG: Zn-dependent hydrolase [Flavobacteriales bacterium]|nr:Zn-dependent hydrolase [Flavobacteriales bacterium]
MACENKPETTQEPQAAADVAVTGEEAFNISRTDIYTPVRLYTNVELLKEEERKMIPLLIKAAQVMDGLFWKEAYSGDRDEFLAGITDERLKRFANINYGPWDRLDDNKPFIEGVGEKPLGANFYPEDMTKDEFDGWKSDVKKSLYTMVRRDSTGHLKTIYYHKYFETEVKEAAGYLRQAAAITTNPTLKYYLDLRADALETDRYNPSDIAWLALEDNVLDIVIGPIENYEDHLYGYKAAHEAYVLVKDVVWSRRLDKYKELLPRLQAELPCDTKYKQDEIGGNAQLNAYDVIYYAGDCNSGSKTIAVNLPNDEQIQQEFGTRRSQLKNAMKAKYDKILLPIADMLIADDQRQHITFDAFFGNTMFHEVAHGLGIKNTVNGKGTVRESLKDQASALEEGKADILGLWMVYKLYEWGELEDGELMDNYVTFLAGIFRSVRFGASSAHGKANMLRFNYFKENGAFEKDPATGKYRVNKDKMTKAMTSLSALILQLQGEGDYEGVIALMDEKGAIFSELASDLERLNEGGIPVDVVFEQGLSVLGLE